MALGYILFRMLRGEARKGGGDKEARKRLEEMAKREKRADEIAAGPVPMGRDQLDKLRDLSD